MDASLITTVVPFEQRLFKKVNQKISDISGKPDVRERLDRIEIVHFVSIVAVTVACPSESWDASQGGEATEKWLDDNADKLQMPADEKAHVIVEISADGSVEQATLQLVKAFGDDIREVLETADVVPANARLDDDELQEFLLDHHCPIHAGWTWLNWLRKPGRRNELGQAHIGSPGMTVWRIRRERDLAEWIARLVTNLRDKDDKHEWANASPLQRLNMVRDHVWREGGTASIDTKWAFAAESAPCLWADPLNPWNDSGYNARNPQARRALANIIHCLAWPLYLPLAAVVLWLAWFWAGARPIMLSWQTWIASALVWGAVAVFFAFRRPPLRSAWAVLVGVGAVVWLGWIWQQSPDAFTLFAFALPKAVAVVLVTVALVLGWLYARLRHLEATDETESVVPPASQIKALMAQENRVDSVQNHMATVSRLKPGLLRRLTLRLAFVVVGTGHFVGRPGFLGKNGVIHVARWLRLPGTSLLMFWSNFDGTWESYVADFIADAPTGVTAIWSNCFGFPRTRKLFGEGAEDRDQLVHWARRQQQPTLFWYSAYPGLTTDRIRTNAAIRQGLASAASDDDARDWLALFGSSQRPPRTLDATEIQTLIFGALSSRRVACMLIVHFEGHAQAREWLGKMQGEVSFGEARPGQPACVLGLAASGLTKLGLPPEALSTFPVAFQQGMWPAWRARALGDTGDNAPENWKWGNEASPPDAVVVVYGYGADDGGGDRAWCKLVDKTRTGCTVLEEVHLDPVSSSLDSTNGSFGFADGISQPVIRGAPRSDGDAITTDLVEPGELVLGYPDNTEKLPPSPAIKALHDPSQFLPNAGTDPTRRRPEFSRYLPETGERDLGANGTFLVVRQFKEEDAAFDNWCRDTYEKMRRRVDIDIDADRVDASVHPHDQMMKAEPQPDPMRERNKMRLIASLLVGRWPNGSSLVRNPRSPAKSADGPVKPDNEFRYGLEDPRAYACPFGAHTRRANPRDTRFHDNQAESDAEIAAVNRHRILRVGRAYGNTTKAGSGGRGLMFMCLNADIERQFEFVQKTWLLNPNIHGLQGEVDPLIGRGPKRTFTVPTASGPVTLDLVDFVKVVGGGYFFLPGRATLRYLVHHGSLPGSHGGHGSAATEAAPTLESRAEAAVAAVK